jgi:hypothetical protein
MLMQVYRKMRGDGWWYLQYDGAWPDLNVSFGGWVVQVRARACV